MPDSALSHVTRAAALTAMAGEPVDLLVIGGGITGAGIARDAALRGIRTALVDKGDFAAGTSSTSSRLVHGGLRYLETREFRLVFESSRERRALLGIAPHVVWPLPFLFPVYRGARVPPWKLRAGMWLYDALATFRNVHRHQWLGPAATRRREPQLRDRDLRGAALYYDAQTDDARLVLATLRSAAAAGALVANYAEATSLLKPDGRARGAVVRDTLTGATRTVRALVVVNATGPWCDALRRADRPGAPALLRLTRGAHVVVPRARLGHTHAVTLTSPIDGRVMFVLPWGDVSYIGTTDIDDAGDADRVHATAADVTYLLRSANAYFPNARLTPADVIATWAALRALVTTHADRTASAVSREHVIDESESGLLTIAGGKLTTHRAMAAELVDRVAARLHGVDGRPRAPSPPTDREPLPGGETARPEVLEPALREQGASPETARHLVRCYGSEAPAVLNRAKRNRVLLGPIAEGRPEIRAEVEHVVEREMAVRLGDVLVRRLHLFWQAADQGLGAAPAVARKLRELLGWDAEREAAELAHYQDEVARGRAWLDEGAGAPPGA
jgi:glycerol-3-phosphate dehydrogenase